MSTYSTLIDDALNRARGRSPQGLKLANAEAPAADAALKIADALEYAAYTLSNDGTPAGDVRAELVRNFFKEAAEGGAPASGATEVTGTQAEAPQAGRTKIPVSAPADAPKVTESPDGKMSREVLAQTPPKDPSKSAGQTLWDVLMKAKEAEGPRVMDAADAAPSHPTGQEGGAQANAALANNEAPVSATRRELHEPTRKRVAEVFESAADTGASQAAAKIVAPKASASGNLKNASFTEIVDAMRKEAFNSGAGYGAALNPDDKMQGGLPAGIGLGGLAGGGLGMLAGGALAGEEGAMHGGMFGGMAGAAKESSAPSILELAQGWDAAYTGQFGDQVKAAAAGIVDSLVGARTP